jgi:formylglycine-generating enzyme required for sulfatase activity
LPTEAEWEFAARGGNKSGGYRYSGSNSLDEVAWYGDNSEFRTQAVGGKKPNELGLHDMSGNVSEWCADWFDEYYYEKSPDRNPKGPSSGSARVHRGDSCGGDENSCRVANRQSGAQDGHYFNVGFRCVRD